MAENTTSSKDRLKEITDGIEQGIKELFTSEKYMQYLLTMSRFHRYSVNNTMLIYMQRPDATLVAGFNKWRDQFSRNVMKGERGIKIIAPTPFKKKIEQEKVDPQTKAPILNPDGTVATEEVEIKIPLYKVVSVFDVAQTDGKPLPTLAENLTGDVQQYEIFMEALRRASPVPLGFAKLSPDLDGFFNVTDQRITIREGMSEVQTVCAAVHEIAHSKLHNKELPEVKEQWKLVMVSDGETKKDHVCGFDSKAEAEAAAEAQGWKYTDENSFEWRLEIEEDTYTADFVKKSRNTEEVEAESVSYAVCAYYGIPTGENSFGYIATWSKDKELSELRASLETINKTSSGLISDIDRHFAEIVKERGVELSAPEAEAPTATPEIEPEHDSLFLLDNERYLYLQRSEEGFDYTFYDKMSLHEIDGGQLDNPDLSLSAARDEILLLYDMKPQTVEKQTAETTEAVLYAAEEAPKLSEVERWENDHITGISMSTQTVEPPLGGGNIVGVTIETYDPEAPLPPFPDGYVMPDATVSVADRDAYGYTENDMLPLSQDKAIELFDKDLTVYMLRPGNSAEMVFEREDIDGHSGLFGITREEWDETREYIELTAGHEVTQKEMDNTFINNPADAFAIYQLKRADETRDLRFEPLASIEAAGLTVARDNYELVYSAPLEPMPRQIDTLENIFEKFNVDRPADFKGHSLSVSDIVALKQAGEVSCHYVDSVGYREVPAFLTPDNPLKNAEMAMEDDYGMIDGIINNGSKQPTVAELEAQVKAGQTISLLDLANAVRDEHRKERPSVVEKLKSQPVQREPKITAPKKSAEREL